MICARLSIAAVALICLLPAAIVVQQLAISSEKKGAPLRPEKPAAEKPRLDALGDPLPPLAVTRLGTSRWRQGAAVTALACSPDGKWIASGGSDGQVRLWDVKTGRQVRIMETLAVGAKRLMFSPDSKFLVAPNENNPIVVWNVETGAGVWTLSLHWPTAILALGPGGKMMAVENQSTQILIRKKIGQDEQAQVFEDRHQRYLLAMQFSKDGKQLISADVDGYVHLYDVAGGRLLQKWGKKYPSFSVGTKWADFAPQTRQIAAYDWRTVHVWDVDRTEKTHVFNEAKEAGVDLTKIVFSPNGQRLACAGKHAKTGKAGVFLWDLNAGKLLHQLADDLPEAQAVCFSADGKTLYTGHDDGHIHAWDTETGRMGATHHADGHQQKPIAIAYSPDSKYLISIGADKTIRKWDVPTGKQLWKVETKLKLHDIAYSPDGKNFAIAGDDPAIRLHDAASGKELRQLKGHKTAVMAVAFHPKGKYLASCGLDQNLRLWDVARGKQSQSLPDITSTVANVCGLTFSRDGRFLVFSEENQPPGDIKQVPTATLVRVIDMTSFKVVRSYTPGSVSPTVAVSPDKRTLAIADPAFGVSLYEMSTGQVRDQLPPQSYLPICALVDMRGIGPGRSFPRPDRPIGGCGGLGQFNSGINPRFGGGFRISGAPGGGFGFTAPLPPLFGFPSNFRTDPLGHVAPVSSLHFAPRGQHILSAGEDSRIVLWDSLTARALLEVGKHQGPVRRLAFAPDGKTFASASDDTTILIWDAPAVFAHSLETLWINLGNPVADEGHWAAKVLASRPAQATELLQQKLKPVTVPSKDLKKWIGDLNSEQFRIRTRAEQELAKIVEEIEPALRAAMKEKITLEVHLRLQKLLDKIPEDSPSPQRLRQQRALELLERWNTTDSRRLLHALAQGTPEAWLTQQAREALQRLPD